MTFLAALIMALARQRDDVAIYLDTGKKARKVIDGYNLQFLDAPWHQWSLLPIPSTLHQR